MHKLFLSRRSSSHPWRLPAAATHLNSAPQAAPRSEVRPAQLWAQLLVAASAQRLLVAYSARRLARSSAPIRIAKSIRRPKSTVSRELSRNRLPSGRYSPLHAAGAYQLRRRREASIEKDSALRTFVLDRLAEGWTPEQISGWLKGKNERCLRAWLARRSTLSSTARQKAQQLWRYLTRRYKRRRPRRSRPSRDTIKDRISIHERPKNVDARTEVGHWEGDLIICKRTRPVLVLHERKSAPLHHLLLRLLPSASAARALRTLGQ